jgi:hypothetical protein
MKTSRASALGLVAALVLPSLAIAVQPPPSGGYPNRVTALGEDALFGISTGEDDTAIGYQALYDYTGGDGGNTAVGSSALHDNTTGYSNVGIGFDCLYGNTTGHSNVAIGVNALVANTTGVLNVAVGDTAMQAHTSGGGNVAIGPGAFSVATTGDYNVAVGSTAMTFSGGNDNVAVGDGALNLASGNYNVALGESAGLNFAGNNNIAIGQYAGQNVTSGANDVEIGNQGSKKDDAVIRIGDTKTQKKTFIAGINGVTVPNGVVVVVDKMGQLGVATSSERFKDDIQPMKDASEVLLSLQPVTFRYKKELDSLGTPQFGLVAEQVAKVDPDLVTRDDSGQPYTVRYEAVNAMLLNEFLKEHRKVESQSAKIEALEKRLGEQGKINAEMRAALQAEAEQIERVNAQLATQQPAPRLVSNPR